MVQNCLFFYFELWILCTIQVRPLNFNISGEDNKFTSGTSGVGLVLIHGISNKRNLKELKLTKYQHVFSFESTSQL